MKVFCVFFTLTCITFFFTFTYIYKSTGPKVQSVSSLFTVRLLKTGVHSDFSFVTRNIKTPKNKLIIYCVGALFSQNMYFFLLLSLQAAKMATSCSHYFGAACTSQSTAIEMKENTGIKS